MSKSDEQEPAIDWRLTTWEGARREALRRWSGLPLEQIVAALEEMEQLSEALRHSSRQGDGRAVAEQPMAYDRDAHSDPDAKP